jgi:pheromone shutdown protein TraB
MYNLIGTTHYDSRDKIESIIKEFNPDVIGVELCLTRFKAFTNKLPTSVNDDSIIGKISEEVRKKAEENNVDYGADMKTAMFYAINHYIKLALLDKDINFIRNQMQLIPEEEMIYLNNELTKYKESNIQKEIDENEVIKEMKEKIPTVFRILVEERNNFLAENIRKLINENEGKRIIIFLGKGHVKEVQRLI